MTFDWPTFPEVKSRVWRLKRLIAVAVLLPLVPMTLLSFFGVGLFNPSVLALFVTLIFLTLVFGSHAVLFPNSYQETLAISVLVTLFGILAPVIGGSFFGWFLFLLFAIWAFWGGQNRILAWQMATPEKPVSFQSTVKTRATLEAARAWFPLRPGSTRGQYRCGDADMAGVFPVWFDSSFADVLGYLGADMHDESEREVPDDLPPTFYAMIEADEPEYQRTQILEGPDKQTAEIQAVVEHQFRKLRKGCKVTEREDVGAYPWGQSLTMWLNDFQADGLVYHKELLENVEPKAIRAAHKWSLMLLASRWFLSRFVPGGMSSAMSGGGAASREVSNEKLSALLARLGPEFSSQGYTSGAMPLVTLDEFFDGNSDDGSIQAAPVDVARGALRDIRNRTDVADVRLGITQWEGPSTWPLAEYIYVVTSAGLSDVKNWLKEANIWVSELSDKEDHFPREELDVPPGHRVVWAWID
ncbi:MAG: hypothetical protein AAF762_02000 [Pseudomonadota bacterium]